MNPTRITERLRVQTLLQRLRRQWGDQEARDIVALAFEPELPGKKIRQKPRSPLRQAK